MVKCDRYSLDATARHVLWEIVEECHDRRSTVITSQPSVEQWDAVIGDPSTPMVFNRLVHDALQIDLAADSDEVAHPLI